jgi:DNA-binding CsgD family transcriptional regulator
MKLDVIGAVEAAYAPAARDDVWLHGVVEALAPLDQGHGVYASYFDASDISRARVTPSAQLRPSAAWLERAQRTNAEATPALLHALYARHPPVGLVSERVRQIDAQAAAVHRDVLSDGIVDVLGIFATEADQRGIMIGVPLADRAVVGPRLRVQLARVAAHVVAARRLRAATNGAAPSPEDTATEAVVTPSGKIEDVRGEAASAARGRLGDAVRRMERARGRSRRAEADQALAAWRGLVDGTWSLLDHVERDGRRYVLARRNTPGVRDPKALAPRERDVLGYAALGRSNKYIAYMLGISASSVAVLLQRAQRKLGIASRRALIAFLASAAAATDLD